MARVVGRFLRPDSEITALKHAYVILGVADGTLLAFIPLYLLRAGLGPPAIGATLAAMAAAALVTGLIAAYLADRRFSPERIVVLSAASASGFVLLLALPAGSVEAAIAVILLAVARAPLTLLDPIALKRLRQSSRTDYARIRLRTSAGWAASVLISGAAYQAFGLELLPAVYAPLAALLAGWVALTLKSAPRDNQPPVTATIEAGRRLIGIPAAMAIFLVSLFLLGTTLAATQNFLTVQIKFLGGGAFLIGAASAFQALTEIPTMGYTHVLTQRLTHRSLFAIGCAIYLVTFIAWALVSNPVAAALLKLVVGVAFALTFVASVMIANDLSPARLRATGQALVKSTMFGLAPILGAFGGGLVYGALGAHVMFLLSAVGVAVAGLIALLGLRPRVAVQAIQPAPVQVAVPERP